MQISRERSCVDPGFRRARRIVRNTMPFERCASLTGMKASFSAGLPEEACGIGCGKMERQKRRFRLEGAEPASLQGSLSRNPSLHSSDFGVRTQRQRRIIEATLIPDDLPVPERFFSTSASHEGEKRRRRALVSNKKPSSCQMPEVETGGIDSGGGDERHSTPKAGAFGALRLTTWESIP